MNIAVFCSGSGSNFQAIVDAKKRGELKADIALMVCDNPRAFALERAKREGVASLLVERKKFKSKLDYEAEIIKNLQAKKVELVVLAGYMRLVSPDFVRRFPNRVINIHPALLPSFKGTQGIKEALDYGVKLTGVTVHFVDEEMDHGPIILQEAVKIESGDSEETLAARIHKLEHRLYPQAIRFFSEGKLKIVGRKVEILE